MGLLKTATATLAALTLGAGVSFAESHGNKYVHSLPSGGQVFMMYQDHMSLYTYANDTPGRSSCYGECAEAWPPAILDADVVLGENYGLVEREDGSMQAAFKGQPLYLSVLDTKVGETNGDGVEGVWFLARP